MKEVERECEGKSERGGEKAQACMIMSLVCELLFCSPPDVFWVLYI